MVNGCYYRVIVAYMTEVRTQKAQILPPKFEKYERNKFAEVYSFYAYDETAIRTSIPESTNRRNLGKKDRTERAGYAGKVTMNNGDPHFGWEIGQFFVGGFTDYENGYNIFSTFYGSLTAIAIFLFWLYCCFAIFLIGALFNFHFEEWIRKGMPMREDQDGK